MLVTNMFYHITISYLVWTYLQNRTEVQSDEKKLKMKTIKSWRLSGFSPNREAGEETKSERGRFIQRFKDSVWWAAFCQGSLFLEIVVCERSSLTFYMGKMKAWWVFFCVAWFLSNFGHMKQQIHQGWEETESPSCWMLLLIEFSSFFKGFAQFLSGP